MKSVPSELRGSVPREVELTRTGNAAVAAATAIAVVALGLAIVLTIVYRQSAVESERRQREAVPVQAIVQRVVVSRDGDNDRHTVFYTYEVEGRRHAGATRVSSRSARRLAPGTRLAIEYQRSAPDTNWLAGRARDGMSAWLIPAATLGTLSVAVIILLSVRSQWRLLSEGRAVEARVVSVGKSKKKDGTQRLTYEFQTLSGARRTASIEASGKAPAPGSLLPIVYHRERPEWTALYPLSLVRPRRLAVAVAPRRLKTWNQR